VNGSLTLRQGAKVAGGLENVNGSMLVEGARVAGGIETVNGDIRLATGSHVTGGIHVEEHKSSWWKGKNSRNPRITIEQGVTVEGPLHFERAVDLYVGRASLCRRSKACSRSGSRCSRQGLGKWHLLRRSAERRSS